MEWDEISLKFRKEFDSDFVSCEERAELDYIKECIKEEFPNLGDAEIEEGLKKCCEELPSPRARSDFLKCLIGTLDF
jgi:hypothetical protein